MTNRPADTTVAKSRKLHARLAPYLDALPIFPLDRVQLFPGAMLPLYVFEPRYRELTAACLARGGIMGVASLRPGYNELYHGRPPVRRVAGVGKIVAHRKNPDGTYNILLRGLGRVRIDAELPPSAHLFREVKAHLFRDHWPHGFDFPAARRTLVVLTERLASLIPQGGEALRALCDAELRARRLCDVLSAALVRSHKVRRQLLELRDVPARLDLLSSELARMIAYLHANSPSGASGAN